LTFLDTDVQFYSQLLGSEVLHIHQ